MVTEVNRSFLIFHEISAMLLKTIPATFNTGQYT